MFGVSFLSPAFLLGALAAALPVALHLIGRQPRIRVPFPAVRLLKRAPAQETRRRHLRELVLLGLRVSAILLLALAFARPYLAAAVAPSSVSILIVAIDRSFSMTAPGQFQRALSLARDAIARVPPGSSVGLLAFDDDAELLVRPTTDRTAVLRALESVRPGYGGTSYTAVLARAADTLASAHGRVVVVTDLQRSGWDRRDAAIPERLDVRVADTGAPSGNLWVRDLRRTEDGLIATVHNAGASRQAGRAKLTIGGRTRGVSPFSLEPGGVRDVVFPGDFPSAGDAAVEIDDAIGYQADNKTYALLDPPDVPALLALTGDADPTRGAFYLERALEVEKGRFFHLDTEVASRFSTSAAVSRLQRYAALVVLGTRGLRPNAAKAIGEYVAAGGGVLVTLDDQAESSSLTQIVGARVGVSFEGLARPAGMGLVVTDGRHPILQSFDGNPFGGVRFARAARLDVQRGNVLARFADGGAAIVELRRGAGRLLIFASDLSNRWNNLPLQPAFLPLVHEVARYLAGNRLPPRELLVSAVPPPIPRTPGIAVRGGGAATAPQRIVVNVDPRESEIARMTPAEFQQFIARSRATRAPGAALDARQAELQQGLWRLAVAIAVIALLAEGLVAGNRGRQVRGSVRT